MIGIVVVVVCWRRCFFGTRYSWMRGKDIAYIAEVVSAEEAAKVQTAGHIQAPGKKPPLCPLLAGWLAGYGVCRA